MHRTVVDLAAAVADGESIDWAEARARLTSSDESSVATELSALSSLNVSTHTKTAPISVQPFPIWFKALRGLSIATAIFGAVGGIFSLRASGADGFVVSLVVLADFATAATVLGLGGRDRPAQALAACYWIIAASFGHFGLVWLTQQAPGVGWWAIPASMRPEAFLGAMLVQFSREFPPVSRFSRVDRITRVALCVALAVGILLFLVNLAPAVLPQLLVGSMAATLMRAEGTAPWFWNLVFATAVPALITIAWRARSGTPDHQARSRLFLYTLALALGPVALEVIAEGVVPPFGRAMQTSWGHWWGGWFIYSLLLSLPLATAYAIRVQRVLDVRVIVRQGLRYLLARWVITWGALVPTGMLIGHAYRHRYESLRVASESPYAQALICIDLVALLLSLCRSRLIAVLDRWALPGLEERSLMVARVAERLNDARTETEIASVLLRGAERALQAEGGAYLVRDGRLVAVRGEDSQAPRQSLLPILLAASHGPCIVEPGRPHSYFALLTDQDRGWIRNSAIAVIVPLLAGRDRAELFAVIALKHRRNALAFSRDDLRFLSAGSASAGLAYDLLQAKSLSASSEPNTAREDFGAQCRQCRRVDAWPAPGPTCACGGVWEPAALPRTVAQRFEITHLLGAGGMGIVYRAREVTLGRDVAIKTLTRLSPGSARRLTEEGCAMAGLSHSNIAVLYAVEAWRGTPLLIMEYLAGGTLAARLKRGRMGVEDTLQITLQLARALAYVHSTGVYHGDIKPTNIGFTTEGLPKFLDFGLSRSLSLSTSDADPHTEQERSGKIAGTPAYLSPEVLNGGHPGPELDIWALCLVLLEAVTGNHPLLSASITRSSDYVDAISIAVAGGVGHPALHHLLERAFLPGSNRYPQRASDLVRELEQVIAANNPTPEI